MATVLITGAGTGFGKGAAFLLAKNHQVIAGVEIAAQIFSLEQEAKAQGLNNIRFEKLDIADPKDREKAAAWDIDVLVNNAGISKAGSLVDIPEKNLREQFEVNVFGTILLTQEFARKMVDKHSGKIIFISSVAGLSAGPLIGAYSASKHAIEAFAKALDGELQEFGVQVATVNPGPFLTGFNDRMFEDWKTWENNPEEWIFDYSQMAFPHEQFEPEIVYQVIADVVEGKSDLFRNVVPQEMNDQLQKSEDELWTKKVSTEKKRHPQVEKAYELEPYTKASKDK